MVNFKIEKKIKLNQSEQTMWNQDARGESRGDNEESHLHESFGGNVHSPHGVGSVIHAPGCCPLACRTGPSVVPTAAATFVVCSVRNEQSEKQCLT